MSDMIRVEHEHQDIPACVSGVWYGRIPGAEAGKTIAVSEPMPVEDAEHLCGIPGWKRCERSAEDLAAVDAAIEAAKSAAVDQGGGAEAARLQQQLTGQYDANASMTAELRGLKDENERLRGELAAAGGAPSEASARVVELQAQLSNATGEAERLRQEATALADENQQLRTANAALSAGADEALRTENAALQTRIVDLEEQLTAPKKKGR